MEKECENYYFLEDKISCLEDIIKKLKKENRDLYELIRSYDADGLGIGDF